MAERRGRETPPHLAESEAASRAPGTSTSPPAPPALNPQLQAAMLGLMTTMTHQFRAEAQANRSPSPPLRDYHDSKVKTRDPDPYDGLTLLSYVHFCHSAS